MSDRTKRKVVIVFPSEAYYVTPYLGIWVFYSELRYNYNTQIRWYNQSKSSRHFLLPHSIVTMNEFIELFSVCFSKASQI